SIRDVEGKVLVHCHAGCDQRDVIAALKARGLWDVPAGRPPSRISRPESVKLQLNQQQAERTAAAFAIWRSTIPAIGTPVEAYLAARGLLLPLPPSIRFHRGLKHPSGGVWP